jgi:enamine deaminase RidA (YjgF/YER057c/UK114 family)
LFLLGPAGSSSTMPITVTERAGRRCAGSGAVWEPKVGYSRAVRAGNVIAVSGTVGVLDDGTFPPSLGDQARRALAIIREAIEALGGRMEHVIRTRMFVTDIGRWQEVAAAHGELFADIRPVTTMVEVSRLIDDAALVEIEADAVVP